MPSGKSTTNSATTETTIKVRSALTGDRAAFEWMVRRFTPLLLAQARLRMRARLRRYCDPEDVVADTWHRAMPRLTEELRPAEGRCTPRIVKFLSTIVNHRVNELFKEMMRRQNNGGESDGVAFDSQISQDPLKAEPGHSVWKPLMLHDDVMRVMAVIDDLDPRDQEIIVLRKVEGMTSQEVAKRLEVTVTVVDTRLSRALARLRKQLPDGIFDELLDEDL